MYVFGAETACTHLNKILRVLKPARLVWCAPPPSVARHTVVVCFTFTVSVAK